MTDSARTVTIMLLILGGLFLLPVLLSPMTGLFGWGGTGMMGSEFGHMAGGGWGLGWMGALAVPLLLVGVIGYLVMIAVDSDRAGSTDDEALTELRAAYARGDIDDEEFENRRWRLRQGDE